MGTAASSFVNPAELDGVGAQPTAKALRAAPSSAARS
jgi:hypothetical protein